MPSDPCRAARPEIVAVAAVVVVVGALLVGGLYALGAMRPPTPGAVSTDRLGPTDGDDIAQYLTASETGLAAATGPRWALVSLRAPVDDASAWQLTDGTTRSQVAWHAVVPSVATPTAVVPWTDDRASTDTARALAVADASVATTAPGTGTTPGTAVGGESAANRADRVAELTVGRLRAGCACVVAMVVRADTARLRAIVADDRVRGIQVLPADAAGGRFAVSVLLPEQKGRVGPLRDDAPVPDA